MERHNGIFGGCWCTYFHDCAEREPGDEGSRAFKKELVEAGRAHAALVMDGEEAVAWAAYGTPEELPNIHHRKQYLAEAEALPDYRITCVFVRAARLHLRPTQRAEELRHGEDSRSCNWAAMTP